MIIVRTTLQMLFKHLCNLLPSFVVELVVSELKATSIRQICKLRDSEQLNRVLNQIDENVTRARNSDDIVGPVESDPEYKLIVEANTLAVEIDNEVSTIHKFTRDKYNKRFPELESLVVNPLDYVRTVKELGNDVDKVKNNEVLPTFLTQATIMVVSVTASTTQGYIILVNI